MTWQLLHGNAQTQLATLPEQSTHTCVTSPPYYGLRDYGVDGQIGLEDSPEAYVERLVDVFREVRRVLRDDGTLWLNLGDSYFTNWGSLRGAEGGGGFKNNGRERRKDGAKRAKQLVGIPWRVAFALQADGWYLRSDIIWAKPNPMPESVTDRPTRAHEYIFLLSKSQKYYYDADAIKEPETMKPQRRLTPREKNPNTKFHGQPVHRRPQGGTGNGTRNKRTVWTVATQPYKSAHFATFPPKLIEPCILAGCPKGGTVLDPFAGAGTTLLVANRLGRDGIGIELNPEYCQLTRERIEEDAPLFNRTPI